MENLKAKCPLGGDGTQDCTGCTVNCARNRALKKRKQEAARKQTPYERTRAAVYATGNKWAIENFNATHN
jgi:aldehyde:ferredoxin oxidoreductase